jgi:hypothetical protein
MSGFYSTLPSNSSMDIYPNNKQSSFTIKLAKELNFNVPHEVALVEISYSPFYVSYMGNIFLNDYFSFHFGNNNKAIQIPLNILKAISVKDYFEIINSLIAKKIEFDDSLIRFKSYFIKSSQDDITAKRLYYEQLTTENLYIEVFKTNEMNSSYRIIDDENSQFKDDFIKVSNNSYNKDLNKWEFTLAQLFVLSKKYKFRIYLVDTKYDINLDLNKFYSFEEIELIDKIIINDSKFKAKELFKIKNDLKNKLGIISLESNDFAFVDYLDYPKFIFQKEYDSRKSIIKISQDERAKKDMIFLDGKIANAILEVNNGLLDRNKTFIIDTIFSPINYAIINTDIIERQYFGDYLLPILKIIPLKSNGSEIVTYFDNLHYVPLSTNRINTITIEISDLFQNYIHFDDKFSFIIIKLHFRKINNG